MHTDNLLTDFLHPERRQRPLTQNLRACRLNDRVRAALGGATVTEAAIALQLYKYHELNYSRRAAEYCSVYHSKLSSRRKVIPGIDRLESGGYVVNHRQKPGTHNRTRSVVVATDLLFDVVGAVLSGSIVETPPPLRLVELRDAKKNPIPYDTKARQVVDMERRLRGHGQLTLDVEISGTEIAEMIRIFNNSSWKQGGRAYGPWQSMPKQERAGIEIAGEATVELDYTAIHPSLLYAEKGLQLPDDCYVVADIDGNMYPRRDVKLALLVLINAESLKSARMAIAGELMRRWCEMNGLQPSENDIPPECVKQAGALIEAVKKRHKPIADAFHSGAGLRLQNIDARIAEAVWWTMTKRGVVVLPVHDSFIVQRSRADELEALMIEAAERIAGTVLRVTH